MKFIDISVLIFIVCSINAGISARQTTSISRFKREAHEGSGDASSGSADSWGGASSDPQSSHDSPLQDSKVDEQRHAQSSPERSQSETSKQQQQVQSSQDQSQSSASGQEAALQLSAAQQPYSQPRPGFQPLFDEPNAQGEQPGLGISGNQGSLANTMGQDHVQPGNRQQDVVNQSPAGPQESDQAIPQAQKQAASQAVEQAAAQAQQQLEAQAKAQVQSQQQAEAAQASAQTIAQSRLWDEAIQASVLAQQKAEIDQKSALVESGPAMTQTSAAAAAQPAAPDGAALGLLAHNFLQQPATARNGISGDTMLDSFLQQPATIANSNAAGAGSELWTQLLGTNPTRAAARDPAILSKLHGQVAGATGIISAALLSSLLSQADTPTGANEAALLSKLLSQAASATGVNNALSKPPTTPGQSSTATDVSRQTSSLLSQTVTATASTSPSIASASVIPIWGTCHGPDRDFSQCRTQIDSSWTPNGEQGWACQQPGDKPSAASSANVANAAAASDRSGNGANSKVQPKTASVNGQQGVLKSQGHRQGAKSYTRQATQKPNTPQSSKGSVQSSTDQDSGGNGSDGKASGGQRSIKGFDNQGSGLQQVAQKTQQSAAKGASKPAVASVPTGRGAKIQALPSGSKATAYTEEPLLRLSVPTTVVNKPLLDKVKQTLKAQVRAQHFKALSESPLLKLLADQVRLHLVDLKIQKEATVPVPQAAPLKVVSELGPRLRVYRE
ncbi:MAG: hypothetical protein Q9164_001857 [Protoblastenia rupestris]